MSRLADSLLIWLTTNRVSTWLIRHIASRLDPVVFKATNGRYFSMGPPAMPMVTLTTTGRRSGKPRDVHLASLEREGEVLVVASAMGQQRHPGWYHNLIADPAVAVQARGERYDALAEPLSDAEKRAVWDEVRAAIPQMKVYERRTDRNICVFRLRRIRPEHAEEAPPAA